MVIRDLVTHYPGESYSNEDLRGYLRFSDDRISDLTKRLRGTSFIEDVLESKTFFPNLGVERRHLFCDPRKPEEWWNMWAGKDPFALQGAIAYDKLMEGKRDLGHIDRVIVISNTMDTASPNMAYALLGHLQDRHENFTVPTSLCLMGEGCSGFISGLREAELYLNAYPKARVVIVTVEMMGVGLMNPRVLRILETNAITAYSDEAKQKLGGMVLGFGIQRYLFGDGCSAALISREGRGLKISATGKWANLDPLDRKMLENIGIGTQGEPDYTPFGFFKQDPKRLFQRLNESYLPRAYQHLQGLNNRPQHFAVHTGSGKILDYVQQALGLTHAEVEPSRYILANQGNMNSTTGAAVLERLLKAGVEEAYSIFFGVGFSLQVAY